MKVCVQGLWHLGTVTAAGLASRGHDVVGLDFDSSIIEALRSGTPPCFEPGLAELVQRELASGRLRFADTVLDAIAGIEILWVAYDTPVDDDDNADVAYVVQQINRTIEHLSSGVTVLISSQMPVGTIARLERSVRERFPTKAITFASAPENLRLGKALDTFLAPDRIVAGVRSQRDRERLVRLLGSISDRVEWMSVESAEMTKHAINAFLATSVTFANEIATICEQVGADAKEVERGLKSEHRIGPKAYLSPGGAFAGGTLARDITYLNEIARENDVATPLLSSVKPSNDEHKEWARRRLLSLFQNLRGVTVAVWGLTYKPGTDTLRRSMSVEMCVWLLAQGAVVRVHDPVVSALPQAWSSKVQRFPDALDAIRGADALIIGTEWPLYKSIPADSITTAAPGIAIIDANRFLGIDPSEMRIQYIAVGAPVERGS